MANIKKYSAALLALAVLFIAQPASATSHKVIFSNAAPVMQLGDSLDLNISLDQPILCDPNVACQVAIDFSGQLPNGITITPSSVVWLASEWSQQRTITVNVDANASALVGQTVTVPGQLTSNASYYAPEDPAFTVAVPAAEEPAVAYSTGHLGNTGANYDGLTLLGGGLLVSGAAVTLLARKRVRK